MGKNIKSIYKIELLILFSIIILFFINNYNYKTLIAIITFGIILFGSLLFYGKKKDNNFFKWPATKIVISVLVCYYLIILISGIYLGFNKTFFSIKIKNIFIGIVPTLIITIITEYLRFVLIRNNFTNKLAIYFITILMILFNITISININILNDSYKIFIFICTLVIPIIAQELLSTYLVLNYGFLPSIVYKLIMNLYLYLIPISTDLGDYLYSVVNILMPFTIYLTLKKFLKVDDIEKNRKNINGVSLRFFSIPTTILLLVVIILVSGVTKYKMIAIASDSMYPYYGRGDAVIFEKIEVSSVQVGDILVFKSNNQILTHRVVKIKENSGILYFYTKGDANNSNDTEPVEQENILGVVRNVIKYIGYPTVKMYELIEGR